MAEQAYEQGFIDKCAAAGVDPVALWKNARGLTEASETANSIGGRLGAIQGSQAGLGMGLLGAIPAALFKRPGLAAGMAAGGTALGAMAGHGIGRAVVPNQYKADSKMQKLKQQLSAMLEKLRGGLGNVKDKAMGYMKRGADYGQGFSDKCDEIGIDPEELSKVGQLNMGNLGVGASMGMGKRPQSAAGLPAAAPGMRSPAPVPGAALGRKMTAMPAAQPNVIQQPGPVKQVV